MARPVFSFSGSEPLAKMSDSPDLSEIMSSLEKTNDEKKGADSLIHRAETLIQEKLPEKHEHDAAVTAKMKNFQRRDSDNVPK